METTNKKTRIFKALIVEDEHNWARELSRILEDEGFQIDAVEKLAEASQAIKENCYDLVTVDLRFPDSEFVDWKGFVGSAIEHNPKAQCVVVSAHLSLDIAREAGGFENVVGCYDKNTFLESEFRLKIKNVSDAEYLNSGIHYEFGNGAKQSQDLVFPKERNNDCFKKDGLKGKDGINMESETASGPFSDSKKWNIAQLIVKNQGSIALLLYLQEKETVTFEQLSKDFDISIEPEMRMLLRMIDSNLITFSEDVLQLTEIGINTAGKLLKRLGR